MLVVLISDDDGLIRLALRAAITHYGHTVVETSDGDDCLRHLQTSSFDLVLMDAQMPGASLDLRLTSARSGPGALPLIAVLTGSIDSATARLLQPGDRLLQKPVELADLAELLAAAAPARLTRGSE